MHYVSLQNLLSLKSTHSYMTNLKKTAFIFSLVAGVLFSSQAQTLQDVFNNTDYPVSWMGIDYSHVKVVGNVGQLGGSTPVSKTELREKYYPSWNYLIIDEGDKYNIARMLHRKYVNKDLDMIKNLNEHANVDSLEVKITPGYTVEEIQSFINLYPSEDRASIGLVFIAESMNKTLKEAYYHVVFYNRQTNEVLLQERMRGEPSGLGIRNYWAGSYYNVMELIKSSAYAKWQTKYKVKPTYKQPTW